MASLWVNERDSKFLLHEVLKIDQELLGKAPFGDIDAEMVDMVVDAAARFGEGELAPHYPDEARGKAIEAVFKDNVVRAPEAYRELWKLFAEGGWLSISDRPEVGGQGLLKHAQTSTLKVAYRELGNPKGNPVVMVHGWPDDAGTWDAVAAELASQGYRGLAPYLRGFGPTRFLPTAATRSGQLTALGQDLLEFAQALELQRFLLIGHDWGARAAYILAALHPQLVRGLVALSVGYGTNDPNQTLSYAQSRNYWYHWFFATPRGRKALETDRDGLAASCGKPGRRSGGHHPRQGTVFHPGI